MDNELLALARRQEMKWQPIRTAPKDGTLILAHLPDSEACYVIGWCDKAKNIRSYFNDDGWCIAWDGESLSNWSQPTHWMPLPPSPTQNADGPVKATSFNHDSVWRAAMGDE